jgi:hypothetical protein
MRVKFDSLKSFCARNCHCRNARTDRFCGGREACVHAAQAASGSFVVSYFDGVAGDNSVRIINPTKSNGSIRALIYVFDASEEMGECFGCPITPNALLSLSVKDNLTDSWAIGSPSPGASVIEVVSILPTGTTCPTDDPACNVGGDFTSTPAVACDPTSEPAHVAVPNLSAWLTHETVGTQTARSVSEFVDEGVANQDGYLPQQCENLINNGSGLGACSCGTPPPPVAPIVSVAYANTFNDFGLNDAMPPETVSPSAEPANAPGWYGTPGITPGLNFFGLVPSSLNEWDSGAIAIQNPSSQSVVVNGVTVDFNQASPVINCTVGTGTAIADCPNVESTPTDPTDPWVGVFPYTIAPGGVLILAQSNTGLNNTSPSLSCTESDEGIHQCFNFDPSDVFPEGLSQYATCWQSGVIPVIHLTLAGNLR